MNCYQDIDYQFGEKNEIEIFELLKPKFDGLQKKSKYSKFDFETANVKIELKTRRNESTKYPTTMIGLNKIKRCTDPNKRFLFIFKFTDKTMFIEYNEQLFSNYETKQNAGRFDRGKPELNEYCYIPIEHLLELGNI